MAKARILIVEDDEDIQELVSYNLIRDGHVVEHAASGEDGLRLARRSMPDLMILDLMLPGIDGLEVCKVLKSQPGTSGIPVLMLTAKGEEADIVAGLEIGADDYLPKPFSPRVLMARVKALLRRDSRAKPTTGDAVLYQELTIIPGRHEVLVHGRKIELTVTEFKVLQLLAQRPGWVFSRSQIVDAVRGDGYPVTDRSVDVQIVGLRRKLGEAGSRIETVRGVGYRFRE